MKKKAIKIATSTAIAAGAFVAAAPANQADAAVNVDQLVLDAQNAGTVLKWAISVEGSADGVTRPYDQFNNAKSAIAKAEAAIKGLSFSEKVKYEARLTDPKIQVKRATAYIDAITSSEKIKELTAGLDAAIKTNDIEKVEAAYHTATAEYRKQTVLLDRVYGQTTRDQVRNAVKPAHEKLVAGVKYEVTVNMLAKSAAADIKAGKLEEAGKKLAEAQGYITNNVTKWKSDLQKSVNDVEASLPVVVSSISRVNDTTVTVNFNKAIDAAAVSHFTFDNGLAVTDAKLSADKKVVTLTTTKQAAGKTFALSYKGTATGKSFSTAANPADTSVVVNDSTDVYLKSTESRAFTATFKNPDGTPYRGFVDVNVSGTGNPVVYDGISITAINGVVQTSPGVKTATVVPNADGNVTITVKGTTGTGTESGKITFKNQVSGKEITTGKTTFVQQGTNRQHNDIEVVNSNTTGKYFVGKDSAGDAAWYSYDTNDRGYNNGTLLNDQAALVSLLNKGNKLNINYQNETSTAGVSDFNVTFIKTLQDLDIKSPTRTADTLAKAFRVAPTQQFNLAGKGHPGYKVHIYRANGGTNEYLNSVDVDASGNWTYPVNLQADGLHEFKVKQQPSTEQRTDTGLTPVFVQEGKFQTTGITSTPGTTGQAVSVGSELVLSFSTFAGGAVEDEAVFSNGSTLTFEDNQGVRATYTVATSNVTASHSTVVAGNKTNDVTIKLGSPTYTWPQGNANVTFNHDGSVQLVAVSNITNQDGLQLQVPAAVKVNP